MRKGLSWALLGVGAFLLAAAMVGSLWAPGVMKKTPLDIDSVTYLTGDAEKINLTEGGTDQYPVQVASITKVDSKASTDSVVVFQSVTCVVNSSEGDAPDCVDGDDPRLVSASEEAFATDRRTAVAVADQAKYVPDGESIEGLVNKWPFDTQKKDYQYWDGMLGRTVTAAYAGTEKIHDLEVYKFEIAVDQEAAEVVEGTQGLYTSEKSIFVDPRTGAIIDQTQHEVRTLEDGTLLVDLTVSFTDEQVKSGVDDAKSNSRSIDLVSSTIPWIGYILGPILLIVGAVGLARGRNDSVGSH